MRNLFSPARVSFAAMALMLQAPAPAYELPALENPEFFGEADGSVGKWSLCFPTVPGCEYTVQQSTDLNEWTAIPGATYYGTGDLEKCYICDGPLPSEPAPTPSPQASEGLGWHLEHWNLNLELVAEGLSSSYRLSRPSYTPFGQTESLAPWDVVLTSPEFAAQAVGRRYLSMIHWQDNTRHTLMLVSCIDRKSVV